MQTRRDQLQAYRFQNRRALAALVTGQPNVLEPPMRRLTVTTLSGIMIAILIAIVFGVLAIIRPSAGDSWKTAGSVIVDQDNDAIYVYSDGVLHPAVNYTSAVLAVSGNTSVSRVTVSSSDIAGATYGFEIGSSKYPTSLPGAGSLLDYPISSCSVWHPRGTRGARAHVTVRIGSTGGTKAVPSTQALFVQDVGDGQKWLLYDGRRLEIGSEAITTSLGLNTVSPVGVGTAFIDSIPQGPVLAPPTLPGDGTPASFTLGGRPVTVGGIVTASGSGGGSFLVTRTHLVPLTALELALYTGTPRTNASPTAVQPHQLNLASPDNPLAAFLSLPMTVPAVDPGALARGGVCAVFDKSAGASGAPRFVIPSGTLTNYVNGSIGQSGQSRRGTADEVDVPPTKALLATSAGAPGPDVVVSEQGVRYSFADRKLIGAFGYEQSDAVHVPPALLDMIPGQKLGLSKAAALQRA
ncbi:type VII secretion protein EccB [Jatrophihabitans endophyticus]|uniref:type VII secretion protein EccB n=1 Tax=Jatrophihabitans endophyticus TaxID=1206085 RepID=UPI0019E83096|nr:type VII secretion protein EccB [Jatrophihabitans endophyticus]MBE7186696.1 type VII secretion protein EccB [Jatrophihabitans endophyticus]